MTVSIFRIFFVSFLCLLSDVVRITFVAVISFIFFGGYVLFVVMFILTTYCFDVDAVIIDLNNAVVTRLIYFGIAVVSVVINLSIAVVSVIMEVDIIVVAIIVDFDIAVVSVVIGLDISVLAFPIDLDTVIIIVPLRSARRQYLRIHLRLIYHHYRHWCLVYF